MSRLTPTSIRHGRPGRASQLALAAVAAGVLMLAGAGAAHAYPPSEREGPYGEIYEHYKYGPLAQENVNVYASPIPGSPEVVLVHGGGWRFYDSLYLFEPEALDLQAQGFTVFVVNYPQDSSTRPAFPLEPAAIAAATQWAIANAAQYNANPGHVALLGGSAGAHLVDLVSERLNQQAPGTVDAVVSLSAPTNFRTLTPLVNAPEYNHPEFQTSVNQALGLESSTTTATRTFASVSEETTYEAENSPALNATRQNCAASLLLNSETELIPLSQARELNARQQSVGCSSTLTIVPGSRHAFAYWSKVFPEVLGFLRTHT
jgi:acetyl esterase/lipase